jgi:truncated hemoglobin YjbI
MARERWAQVLQAGLTDVDKAVAEFFAALMEQTGTQRDMQKRRDAWQGYEQKRKDWLQTLATALRASAQPPLAAMLGARAPATLDTGLELVGDDVVENKIIASRIALTVMEDVAAQFDALRLRLRSLELHDLGAADPLRAETVSLHLVESWLNVGLPRDDLQMATEPLQRAIAALLQSAYQSCNEFLAERGVAAQQEMRVRVQRSPTGGQLASGAGGLASHALEQSRQAVQSARGGIHSAGGAYSHSGGYSGASAGPYDAAATPLLRARQRAQGVMVQLRRLLAPALGGMDLSQAPPASAALAHALAAHRVQADVYYSTLGAVVEDYSPAAVVQVAGAVRERSAELKKKAGTDSEKAIIEVVALMFQSILSEDRIPPAVRVWFARLQVPVLRVALAEPEFFSNMNHPARKLIDRMGAVALGFDSASVSGTALENEVRRIVQVIEQYPETGRRVFQLVHDEFEKFLTKHLTEKHGTAKLVSVAQQVEQKETLTIKYTIELRTMLSEMPVREEVREFLFKTWAEVLALSAVRHGAQHAETVSFRRTAADLVWAASAKPNRSERAQVIQSLPGILQRLREGLLLVGISGQEQDAKIKLLTDTLADAFMSKTAAIPLDHIEAMARRLANVEEFLDDAVLGELPLDAEHIEMMTGIDASAIQVFADNDAPVDDAMVAWARELVPGDWFTLDINGASAQVQYAWHSKQRQLHLLVSTDAISYLIQVRRLAAYLQAGLLVPRDEDGLTVRATREALAKLNANPERLLA